jgi:glycosyltransferase involved in cell wall biosynthesis
MQHPRKPRLLVFVIAYHAETTLPSVLERIPQAGLAGYDWEVLIVDDASEDRTFAIGRECQKSHPEIRMTVLRNEYNQGYGGNQKVGYAYAVARGFDFVAMVHGDGQYAPEELPRLLEPLRDGKADAVFGSRMIDRFGALKGGMPLYKYVGNKILTRVQNALLRTTLSEFHSGYRIYSVRTLDRIPYQLNSNDFHFDTEVIIQLLNAGARIVELPIPTFYGDEISRVNGMKYAKDVVLATLQNVAHRSGVLYQRRFDPKAPDPPELKLGYASSHTYALDAIPAGSRVLFLGHGSAPLAGELRAKGCRVTVVADSLDDRPGYDASEYDVLLFVDAIEHVGNPERLLERIRSQLGHEPKKLVLVTPNVAFFIPRLMLLAGQFNYGKAGILDRTHTRLFTFRSIRHLLRDAGFRIKEVRGVPGPFPKAFGGPLGRLGLVANQGLIRLSRTLFAYEIFIEAESTPDVDFLVRDAQEKSLGGDDGPFTGTPGPGRSARASVGRSG